jgi:hypothetical protein
MVPTAEDRMASNTVGPLRAQRGGRSRRSGRGRRRCSDGVIGALGRLGCWAQRKAVRPGAASRSSMAGSIRPMWGGLVQAETAMQGKKIRLHYPATCVSCGIGVAQGDKAWWSARAHAVTCVACAFLDPEPDGSAQATATTQCSPPTSGHPGVAGGSAQREYDRRHQPDHDRVVQQ